MFEHVCYDIKAADFAFFAPDDNVTRLPIIYDHRRGAQAAFRHRAGNDGGDVNADFVMLSKWTPYRPKLSWSPKIVREPLPMRRKTLRGVFALSAPFVPTNLGHVAWDEAFPLLVAMAQLGAYAPSLNIIRTHGCDTLESMGSRRVCAKFATAFLAPLLGRRGASLQTLAQLARAHRGESHVCFEQLLVGGAFDSFNSEELNNGKEPLLALYRARVLAWHNVPFAAVPTRHSILLVAKDGRRGIHNFKQLHDHVVARFGHVASVRITSFSGLTMAEQLSLVASTTIAISPCGGISMILPFLPEGAHAILMNYMATEGDAKRHGECLGCSWTMEAELWRHVRHVRKQYYQVWEPADFAGGKPGRDSAIVVNPQRLEGLIAGAIHDMQPR